MFIKLSKNFELSEFTDSETAEERGIDNSAPPWVVKNLVRLCDGILQPLRAKLDKPIRITSGYRCPDLNKAVDGDKKSEHLYGRAADIVCDSITIDELFEYIARSNLPFNQVIHEHGRWVHVSIYDYEQTPRREVLRATKNVKGRTVYTDVSDRYAK